MTDPTDIAIGAVGGGGLGAVVVGLLKWFGSRNIASLDATLSDLRLAVSALSKDIQSLREAHIGLAKDLGAVTKDQELLRERIDGLAKHWNERFDEYRKLVHDRLNEANKAMIEAVEQASARRAKK